MNSEDNKGALGDCNKMLDIDPKIANAYRNRGICKENDGDLKGACADWEKASSLADKDAAGWAKDQCQ